MTLPAAQASEYKAARIQNKGISVKFRCLRNVLAAVCLSVALLFAVSTMAHATVTYDYSGNNYVTAGLP